MKVSWKNILLGFVIALFLLGGLWGGYKLYPSLHPCPETTSDTVYVYDTVWHTIHDTIPWYVIKHDSIVYHNTVFKDVDTAAILKDYFAIHYYTRLWQDTLISIVKHEAISKNDFISSELTYKLLKPMTVINNVTNNNFYSRYIIFGADIPFKQVEHMNVNIDVMYVTSRYYLGAGYNSELNCPTVKGGITMFRFK
jgi:hypothetical protein